MVRQNHPEYSEEAKIVPRCVPPGAPRDRPSTKVTASGMDLSNNSSVFRIPVSDPTTGKNGLLHFSLPRECVACDEAPEFYATPDTFIEAPAAPAEEPASSCCSPVAMDDVATSLDLALESIREGRHGLSTLQGDYDYADFTLHRAQSDFRRLDGPLDAACADTPTRNVSSEGDTLDFQLWGARNSLHDCASGAVRTATDAQSVSRAFESAAGHLSGMREALGSTDGGVLALLDAAQQAIESATERNELARGAIGPCVFDLRNADGGLLFAEQQVADIRNDRTGIDVSRSAKELRDAIHSVNDSLKKADDTMAAAREHVGPSDEAADHAELALETLRQQLAQA